MKKIIFIMTFTLVSSSFAKKDRSDLEGLYDSIHATASILHIVSEKLDKEYDIDSKESLRNAREYMDQANHLLYEDKSSTGALNKKLSELEKSVQEELGKVQEVKDHIDRSNRFQLKESDQDHVNRSPALEDSNYMIK